MLRGIYSQISNFRTFNKLFSLRQIMNRIFDYPLTINMLITSDCNLRCRICSAQAIMQDNTNLSTQELKGFMDRSSDPLLNLTFGALVEGDGLVGGGLGAIVEEYRISWVGYVDPEAH